MAAARRTVCVRRREELERDEIGPTGETNVKPPVAPPAHTSGEPARRDT